MRNEYPRPQMVRNSFINLNGAWEFAFDFSKSGMDREFYRDENFSGTHTINVPFCPESSLSGIGFTDFMPAVWYRKKINLESIKGRTLLHFGAVDYFCSVFVNEQPAGTHKGGYSSFCFDITGLVREGENSVVVYAEDDNRAGRQPSGKQCFNLRAEGCFYTRTTGIWQTVWIEFVPETYIHSYKLIPDLENAAVGFTVSLRGDTKDFSVLSEVFYKGRPVGDKLVKTNGGYANVNICLSEKHVWDVGKPELYDLKISLLKSNNVVDIVDGYFGLRSIYLYDNAIFLNGRPVFQRLVLDQGYYPDGIYTAPTDEALKQDIIMAQSLGFNGARLHEKVFEERYLYYADRLGFLVWGEFPSWGLDITAPKAAHAINAFLPEWTEAMNRDFNHPCIIGWCPFNETWDNNWVKQDDSVLSVIYAATKALDPTRPVIDTSGNYHVVTDVYDIHDYEQDAGVFSERYSMLKKGETYETFPGRQTYGGQPFFVSEYGGTKWNPDAEKDGWGYGKPCESEDEVIDRYVGLTDALLSSKGVCALCYTQLYDVEQEQNGLFTYERKRKFSEASYDRIRAINTKAAAIEV